MFHAKDGWFFVRNENGSVTIFKRKEAKEDSPVISYGNFTPEEWASVVASVSEKGEHDRRFFKALHFHNGGEYFTEQPSLKDGDPLGLKKTR